MQKHSISGRIRPLRVIRLAVRLLAMIWLIGSLSIRAQVTFLGTQSIVSSTNLVAPYGVVTDAAGDVYVSDPQMHEIACYTASYAPCGAPFPMQAGLSEPEGMAIDAKGDIFVADAGAGAVLELVWDSGRYRQPIVLVDSLSVPEAVAVDAAGDLFIADTGNDRILRMTVSNWQYGTASAILSGISHPVGVIVDPYGSVFLSAQGSAEVLESTLNAGSYNAPVVYQSLPGAGGGAGVPGSLSMDSSLNLYVSDVTTHQVMVYRDYKSILHPISATVVAIGLATPGQVAITPGGTKLMTDESSGSLVQVVGSTQPFPNVTVGSAKETQQLLLSVAAGTEIGAIDVLTGGKANGEFQRGSGDTCVSGLFAAATVCSVSVTFQPQYSGVRMGAVLLLDGTGQPELTEYLHGTGVGSRLVTLPASVSTIASGLPMPAGVAVDGSGDLFVSDGEIFTTNEYPAGASGYGSPVAIPVYAANTPAGVTIDGAGNLLIASSGNDRVSRMVWNGSGYVAQQEVGSGLYAPSDAGIGPDGSMCIANTYENQVRCYNWNGTSYVPQAAGYNYRAGGIFATHFPLSAAIDAAGNVFWVQPYQNVVSQFENNAGLIVSLWQNNFQFPTAVALDGEGDLYVLDAGDNRVMMMVPVNGVYQEPVLVASGLNAPQEMTVDAAGNLYVADTGNHRVVKITMTQGAQLQFNSTTTGSQSSAATQSMQVLSVGASASTVTSVSYPSQFQSAPTAASGGTACTPGLQLQQGQGCTVTATFTAQKTNAQVQGSIAITAQMASGEMLSYTVPVVGTSAGEFSQTIGFASQAPLMYGQGMMGGRTSFTLIASSSAGLPVTFSVASGPGVIAGLGATLEALGAGTIVVRAEQAGNASYAAAPVVEQTFTVLPATLTVTASDQQLTYGASPSSFGYTITGFVAGDTASTAVGGNPGMTTSAGAHPSVGTYSIQVGTGTLTAANYNFVFVPGKLTITPASLYLIPYGQVMQMGAVVPMLTYDATGFVGGDTLANATAGAPVLSTTANSQSLPGYYPIQIAPGTLSAKNYVLLCEEGSLQVVWSGGIHIDPPGIFAPPPIHLRGVPVLPLHAWGVQRYVPFASSVTVSSVSAGGDALVNAEPQTTVEEQLSVPTLRTYRSVACALDSRQMHPTAQPTRSRDAADSMSAGEDLRDGSESGRQSSGSYCVAPAAMDSP